MSESEVFLFSGKYFLIGKKRIHVTKVTGNASIKIIQGCLIWVPNSPFVRQQDPATLLRRCSGNENPVCFRSAALPCQQAVCTIWEHADRQWEHCKRRAACWHLNHHLVLPFHTQGWPWGSVQWHPEVLLWMVSAEGKEQGSALGFASRRAGWPSANQTRKIHFFFYISHVSLCNLPEHGRVMEQNIK